MNERIQNTLDFLASRRDLFDRITKNKEGGRVRWKQRKPIGYDGKKCLPWDDVRGRYWYPWRGEA